jgi:protein-S-isoprenylcysteine O-methyltransferase Ste14
MGKVLGLIYGVAAYFLFLVVIVYAIGFVADWLVPKSIDSGTQGDLILSLLINTALLGVFAVQHSVMARPGFKAWWTKIVPQSIERSTYVVFSGLALLLLFWKWQPLPGTVWKVEESAGVIALWGLCGLGWLMVFASSFAISHFDLFGLRQVYLNLRNQRYSHLQFRIVGLYRLVRHPLMLGFVIALWATPHMTVGHLFFAAATTLYILIALQLEERDLVAHYGEEYTEYRKQVPMLLPLPRKTTRNASAGMAE